MVIGAKGLSLIKLSEAFKSKPYLCPAGIPTIGYGSTVYENGTKVTLKDKAITEVKAEDILKYQVAHIYGNAINRYVQVPINQNQFDALCSFAYNVGIGNLQKSTLLKLLNKGLYLQASNEFLKWNKAGKRVLRGLTTRRQKEKELFNA